MLGCTACKRYIKFREFHNASHKCSSVEEYFHHNMVAELKSFYIDKYSKTYILVWCHCRLCLTRMKNTVCGWFSQTTYELSWILLHVCTYFYIQLYIFLPLFLVFFLIRLYCVLICFLSFFKKWPNFHYLQHIEN